jgi:UDP-N-acetylglucosamine--N-acetylmuramyl-(pentapeptide) pyrophosphoryl-undecaprenol N-acetylglucosamine transferase
MTLYNRGPAIVLAAGGTGGHLFPAEALAKILLERNYRVALMTDIRGATFADRLLGAEFYRVDTRRTGGNALNKAQAAGAMLVGIGQSLRHFQRVAPSLVVGFGGYPSVPTVLAAQLAGIPTLLHEQNTLMGKANKLLAHFATAIATSFPQVQQASERERAKMVYVGHPVRPEFEALRQESYEPPYEDSPLRILITGGSQGASIFADLVPAALGQLPEHLRARLSIVQQCRAEDLSRVAATYRCLNIAAEVGPFFADLAARLKQAHLAIGRSGASTVIENAIAGCPSVFVPLATVASDQTTNALVMEEAGAAIVLRQATLTPEILAARLAELLDNPFHLAQMAGAARAAGKPNAAETLANLVGDLLEQVPTSRLRTAA